MVSLGYLNGGTKENSLIFENKSVPSTSYKCLPHALKCLCTTVPVNGGTQVNTHLCLLYPIHCPTVTVMTSIYGNTLYAFTEAVICTIWTQLVTQDPNISGPSCERLAFSSVRPPSSSDIFRLDRCSHAPISNSALPPSLTIADVDAGCPAPASPFIPTRRGPRSVYTHLAKAPHRSRLRQTAAA